MLKKFVAIDSSFMYSTELWLCTHVKLWAGVEERERKTEREVIRSHQILKKFILNNQKFYEVKIYSILSF